MPPLSGRGLPVAIFVQSTKAPTEATAETGVAAGGGDGGGLLVRGYREQTRGNRERLTARTTSVSAAPRQLSPLSRLSALLSFAERSPPETRPLDRPRSCRADSLSQTCVGESIARPRATDGRPYGAPARKTWIVGTALQSCPVSFDPMFARIPFHSLKTTFHSAFVELRQRFVYYIIDNEIY